MRLVPLDNARRKRTRKHGSRPPDEQELERTVQSKPRARKKDLLALDEALAPSWPSPDPLRPRGSSRLRYFRRPDGANRPPWCWRISTDHHADRHWAYARGLGSRPGFGR